MPDGWEIRWHSEQVLSLGVIRRDNTVIAGTTGHGVGSLYLPQGGTFRIRVKGNDPIPWDVAICVLDPNASPDDADDHFYAPTSGPAFKPEVATDSGLPPASPDDTTASTGASTNDTAAPATPPAPPALPTQLSGDQVRALVQIKGDRAAGTGFFAKLGKDKFIVTTQQLIASNPNWKVSTLAGNPVEVTKIEGAKDRDVALLSVKDFDYPALDVGNADTIQAGDMVLTGSEDNPAIPSTDVISVSPQRIEIDGLTASPGSPVVLARTGQVVGVVTSAPELTGAANFARGNFDDRDQAAAGSVASYALRLDDIPARETYDPLRLQVQAQFLDAVHQHSRALDAYLNGGGAADQRLWQGDDKIKTANDTLLQNSAGGDTGRAQRCAAHADLRARPGRRHRHGPGAAALQFLRLSRPAGEGRGALSPGAQGRDRHLRQQPAQL